MAALAKLKAAVQLELLVEMPALYLADQTHMQHRALCRVLAHLVVEVDGEGGRQAQAFRAVEVVAMQVAWGEHAECPCNVASGAMAPRRGQW